MLTVSPAAWRTFVTIPKESCPPRSDLDPYACATFARDREVMEVDKGNRPHGCYEDLKKEGYVYWNAADGKLSNNAQSVCFINNEDRDYDPYHGELLFFHLTTNHAHTLSPMCMCLSHCSDDRRPTQRNVPSSQSSRFVRVWA
jgi:hypothetical protein